MQLRINKSSGYILESISLAKSYNGRVSLAMGEKGGSPDGSLGSETWNSSHQGQNLLECVVFLLTLNN